MEIQVVFGGRLFVFIQFVSGQVLLPYRVNPIQLLSSRSTIAVEPKVQYTLYKSYLQEQSVFNLLK